MVLIWLFLLILSALCSTHFPLPHHQHYHSGKPLPKEGTVQIKFSQIILFLYYWIICNINFAIGIDATHSTPFTLTLDFIVYCVLICAIFSLGSNLCFTLFYDCFRNTSVRLVSPSIRLSARKI